MEENLTQKRKGAKESAANGVEKSRKWGSDGALE
jgi:hypothetical protein